MLWRTSLLAIACAQSFLGKYYYFEELEAELSSLATEDVEPFVVGTTFNGNEIPGVKVNSHKPRNVLVVGGLYGNDFQAVAECLEVLRSAILFKDTLDFNMWIVPLINVDSYKQAELEHDDSGKYLDYRKNQRPTGCSTAGSGVNLKLNFPGRGGGRSQDPCVHEYAGRNPFSEPESNVLGHLLVSLNFDAVIFIDSEVAGVQLPHNWEESAHYAGYTQMQADLGDLQAPLLGGGLIDFALRADAFALAIGNADHGPSLTYLIFQILYRICSSLMVRHVAFDADTYFITMENSGYLELQQVKVNTVPSEPLQVVTSAEVIQGWPPLYVSSLKPRKQLNITVTFSTPGHCASELTVVEDYGDAALFSSPLSCSPAISEMSVVNSEYGAVPTLLFVAALALGGCIIFLVVRMCCSSPFPKSKKLNIPRRFSIDSPSDPTINS